MIIPPEKRRVAIYLLLVLIFLIASITIVGNIYLTSKITAIKKETQANLTSIAYLKVARIQAWWEERLGNAEVIFNDGPMILMLRQFLETGGGNRESGVTKDILTWMEALRKSADYEDIMLLDTNGAVKLALYYKDTRLCGTSQQLIPEALSGRRVVATDIYRCNIYQDINIDMLVPLFPAHSENSNPIGLILLRINPNTLLYPIVQYWPVPSRTAETLLVRREGDHVLYLNELRYKKDTALSLKLPLTRKELTSAMAAKGWEGVVQGIDYRSVKVLAVIQKIPNTSWYLIAKEDEVEAYSPVRREVLRVSIVAFLLVVISIVFVALVWNQQITGFYRIRYEIETRRIKVEDDLRKANEEWERTINAVSDALFIVDPDRIIIKGNKAFFDMLGAKPDEVIGRNCYEVMHKLNQPWPNCPLERTKLELRPHTEEVEDPEIGLSLLVSTSPIFDDKGKLIGAVHISKDISERKRTERELQEAKDGLERTNRELRKLDQLKSDFISTVSHELRTPLAIIKEGINLIVDKIPGDVNKKQQKILEVSSHNIDRLARIINSLLDISKIEAGKVELKKTFISLREIISQIALSFEGIIKQKGLELELDIDKTEGKVYADADRIAQVITNLLDNAIKFTDKGRIKISCSEKDDKVECRVSDTGKGISRDDLPKVFDKFQQFGRLAGPGEKGTGLGLSIAKNIIELHNGSISVDSEIGKGTKFTFVLHKYTPESLFREYMGNAIKNAISNNLKVSIIIMSGEMAKAAEGGAASHKLHDTLNESAKLIKNMLHHKGEDVIRNDGDTMIILTDCNRQKCLKTKEKVEEILLKVLSAHGMDAVYSPRIGCATYPDDATDAMDLLARARADFTATKKA